MAKISTTSIRFNGKLKTFEVHYTTKTAEFFVKLPEEYEAQAGKKSNANTEREAIKKAQEICETYEKLNKTRRRVIMVYYPDERDSFGRMNYSGFDLKVFSLEMSYRLAEEVTVDGEKRLIDDRGRAQTLSMDNFATIEWTQEREDYFARAIQNLQNAKDRIRKFLTNAEQNPALIDNAGQIQLTEGIPDGSIPAAGNNQSKP